MVKKGTNRLEVPDSPGPSSFTQISIMVPSRRHPMRTAPPVSSEASVALRSRLISTCSSWSGSPRTVIGGLGSTSAASRVSELTARPTQSATLSGCNCGRGSLARRA